MKAILITLLVHLLAFTYSFSQETAYQKVMKKEITKLSAMDSTTSLQQSANAFSRIAQMNDKEWQPLYFEALVHIYQSFNKSLSLDQKDEQTDLALQLIKKADLLSTNNSEIIALQGFAMMAKLTADPASRGQTLSGQAMGLFQKAVAVDNKNPRALILLAQMELGMSKFFGTSNEKACKLASQSLGLFENQDELALQRALLPTWGKNITLDILKNCK